MGFEYSICRADQILSGVNMMLNNPIIVQQSGQELLPSL